MSTPSPKPVRLIFAALGLVATAAAGAIWGHLVPLGTQASIASSLQNTSAIIFGVMGAWIAIVYPEAMKNIIGKHKDGAENGSDIVHRLLFPMIISTAVLASIVISQPIGAPIAASFTEPDQQTILRRIAFSGLAVLSTLQFYALLLTLYPLGVASRDVAKAHDRQETQRRMGATRDRTGE